MNNCKMLVIGLGEVGEALRSVLEEYYDVDGLERGETRESVYDVIHICFPYSGAFIAQVKNYKELYLKEDGLVIIHSTVPVGTSSALGTVHSPIRGVHPNLAKGILTFTKYFGGRRAKEAASLFSEIGISVEITEKSETTEALKLWDTTYYGWNIILNKAVKEYCDLHGLDFDIVYTSANKTYNKGYDELGMGHVRRPVLNFMEGPIGGHCVLPNCKILGGDIADFITNY